MSLHHAGTCAKVYGVTGGELHDEAPRLAAVCLQVRVSREDALRKAVCKDHRCVDNVCAALETQQAEGKLRVAHHGAADSCEGQMTAAVMVCMCVLEGHQSAQLYACFVFVQNCATSL